MKQHLLLLHGAIGSKQQLQELADILEDKYIVHTISFSAHGGTHISEEPFSIELFAEEVLNYLQENNIAQTTVFGYSMGGYVALYLAKYYPQKINKVITLATKFYWDEEIAAREIKMLDADLIQKKLPAFAQQLQQRHAPQDWKIVLEKTFPGLPGENWLELLPENASPGLHVIKINGRSQGNIFLNQ